MYDDPLFLKHDPNQAVKKKSAYPYRELFALLRESGYDRQTQVEVGEPQLVDVKGGVELMRYYKAMWEMLANP